MLLFRKEAISHQSKRLVNVLTLAQPKFFKLTVLILSPVVLITFLFSVNHYRKESVFRSLMLNKCFVKRFSKQSISVDKVRVNESARLLKLIAQPSLLQKKHLKA